MSKSAKVVIFTTVLGGYIASIDGGEKREISVEEYNRLTGNAPEVVSDPDVAPKVEALEAKVKELTDENETSSKALEDSEKVITDLNKDKEALEAKVKELTERVKQLEAVPPAEPSKPGK